MEAQKIHKILLDRKAATYNRDTFKSTLLGTLLAEINNEVLRTPITDETRNMDVFQRTTDAIVNRIVKKFISNIDSQLSTISVNAKNEAFLTKLKAEREIIIPYMPTQMTDEEIRVEVLALKDKNPSLELKEVMNHFKTLDADKAKVVACFKSL